MNKNKTISPLIKGKKNDEQISSYTSSKMSGVSNSYLDSNDIKKKKSEKENNNKDNDSEASFQSSYFSNDSQSNDDIIIHKKIIPKSYKSSKCIKYYNHWESKETTNVLEALNHYVFKKNIKKEDVYIIDIGANIGWYTFFLGKYGYQIISFEPSQLNTEFFIFIYLKIY